ncbi:hypothetical protein GYMLUDRAFT_377235 [Collybiopsis luxurians FD-317 M1]|uniref:Uncharacterized protein n=1 Tax=Collybiopsis luxurians FD-317 M1 TaxID=944289 RepID=A0A0D0BBT6_9AGAR|nr:hypothetical protein GYMLUDRAFT_377235 [Collybiopsis luxurians FD-317 M1]
MHFLDSGLWEDHIYEQHKVHIKNVGRSAAVTIDNRFKSFPRWSKVHHFEDGISKITFNDGSKNHDISKIFLFAVHDVIPEEVDNAGFTLLRVTRHYINMVMYAGLNVHTSDTISAGRASVKNFATALKRYISQTQELDKNWNFIKLHYTRHCFDDIESKGVLRGLSTKPNEKFHGPLRKIYLRLTNFKGTAKQIMRFEHQNVITTQIWDGINLLDAYNKPDPEELDDLELPVNNDHFRIGSKLKPLAYGVLKDSDSHLFSHFHIRVSDFMNILLSQSKIPLPGGKRIKFNLDDTIVPYQFLKINYESLETWRVATDLLQCNPNFQNAPRFDFIIFATVTGPVFAQLRYLFVCTVAEIQYPIALIQAYKVVHAQPQVDRELGLLRVRKERATELISVQSIIRGAVLIPASNDPLLSDEMLVWDVLDGDMFLQLK